MKFISFNGYDLSHLNPFLWEFIQPARNEITEKRYKVLFEFSHHCFTKSPNKYKGETLANYPAELKYETEKETRIFCIERYQLSLRLPEILKEMDKNKCFFTSADDKFMTISIEEDNGEIVDYEIYFSLKKSNIKNEVCALYIFINSAYKRTEDYKLHSPRRHLKPVSLFVLLYNTLNNKRIKKPR